MQNLASVERLAIRLGVTLTGAERARAEDCLKSASVRARSIAERKWANPDDPSDPDGPVPDTVEDVVLAAAYRLYRNPDRFVVNQAGSFQATIPTSDFTDGDIFLRKEVAELEKVRPGGNKLFTMTLTREDEVVAPNVWAYPASGGAPMPVFGDDG